MDMKEKRDSVEGPGTALQPMPADNKDHQSVLILLPSDVMEHEKSCKNYLSCIKTNLLTILMFLAVVFGIALGFGLRQTGSWTPRQIMYVNYPGELFLRMLRCMILPLIVSSLVSAIGSLDVRLSGKIGARAVIYYLLTTILAIILGIILVVVIHPGAGNPNEIARSTKKATVSTTEDTLMDLIRNMFPPNILQACLEQFTTVLVPPNTVKTKEDADNTTSSNVTEETNKYEWKISSDYSGGTNILGLVVFSVALGITLAKMGEKGKPLLDVFITLSDAIMMITKCVIWLSPLGVLFLIAAKILEMTDFSVVAGQLGMYTVTVLVGLFLHALITLPVLYSIATRSLPFKFISNMMQAITTAFGTASSSATLPVTFTCLEDKNQVDTRVSRFCLPIGATINMDGTALYEAVAAIFIAQVRNLTLDAGKIIAISITATAASVGAAGIPQAGLVTMVIVLNAVGLPADDVTLIFLVDWFLDRFRTAINVLGDAIGAGIVAHLSREDLQKLDKDLDQEQQQQQQLVWATAF
ncbi:excitatory amino acid transporter 1-like isoform X2 [Tachypleus tridentatus]